MSGTVPYCAHNSEKLEFDSLDPEPYKKTQTAIILFLMQSNKKLGLDNIPIVQRLVRGPYKAVILVRVQVGIPEGLR